MKDPDKLMELLNNPYTEELLRADSDIVNYSVMRMVSACELLEDAAGEEAGKGFRGYIDLIRSMCRNMLRNAAVNNAMSAGSKGCVLIRADRFLEDVAAGCKHILGENFKIVISERSKGIVRTDPDLLRFFMLGIIRRAIKCEPDGILRAEAGSVREDGNIRLYIRFKGNAVAPPEDELAVNSFFDANYSEICEVVSGRLGIVTELTDSGISFSVPEADGGAVEAKAPFVYFDPEDLSLYRIMLGDIDL